ncbi:MAG: hypothetical protein NTZ67_02255 [Gammaproteobacteria bacterium]|nr:hypothetical protein [Gammaproteobacteria bacterium]
MSINTFTRLSLLSVVVFALTGCGTEENYKMAMNSWQGAPAKALVNSWGQPEDVNQLPNGNQEYIYRTQEQETGVKVYPQNTGRLSAQPSASLMNAPSSGVSTGNYSFSCESQFEINHQGIIINTSFSGNNCVSTKAKAKHWAY